MFPLTDKFIIDPICTMLEPPRVVWRRMTAIDEVVDFIESQIVTRIIAISTAAFASVDILAHLVAGTYFCVRSICTLRPDSQNIIHYFQRAGFYLSLAVVGSTVGVLYPKIFRSYQDVTIHRNSRSMATTLSRPTATRLPALRTGAVPFNPPATPSARPTATGLSAPRTGAAPFNTPAAPSARPTATGLSAPRTGAAPFNTPAAPSARPTATGLSAPRTGAVPFNPLAAPSARPTGTALPAPRTGAVPFNPLAAPSARPTATGLSAPRFTPPSSAARAPSAKVSLATAQEKPASLSPEELRELLAISAADRDALNAIWQGLPSLESRGVFVDFFSEEAEFETIRSHFAATIYRPIYRFLYRTTSTNSSPQPQWHSSAQITDAVGRRALDTSIFHQAFYFHGTGQKDWFQSILTEGKILVRKDGAFKGAFVSTRPEPNYGPYYFAFKKSIEWSSELASGFNPSDFPAYWAGFSQDIPVTEETLAYVIVDLTKIYPRTTCEQIERECSQWTNRQIRVISLTDVQPYLQEIARLNMGIPALWPRNKQTT